MSYNYGIALSKIAACAGVVFLHFSCDMRWALVSVPLFMLIASFLGAKSIDNGFVLKRVWRLYVPFAAWGVIYFIAYSIIERHCDFFLLVEQLIVGVPVCPPLYFMAWLILFTMLIWFCRRFFSSAGFNIISGGLVLGCFLLQYSGVSARLCSGLPLQLGSALGRLPELLPFALAGYVLWQRQMSKWIHLALSLFFLFTYVLLWVTAEWAWGAKGFDYQGVPLFVLAIGILTFMIFVGQVATRKEKGHCEHCISYLAGLSAGIYYVHILVGRTLELFIGRHRGWLEASAVFCLSAISVAVLKKIRRVAWLVE